MPLLGLNIAAPCQAIAARTCLPCGARFMLNSHSGIQKNAASFPLRGSKIWCQYSGAVPESNHESRKKMNTMQEIPAAKSTPLRTAAKVLISSLLAWFLWSSLDAGVAYAASSSASIKTSSLGLRIASFFQRSGFPNEFIVVALASLPVLELRGAIPVGYWLQLDPWIIYVLSVIGNMIPIPFVLLYLDKLSASLADRSSTAKKLLEALYRNTRLKAGPIQEFKWLGLMLFVAVPFPGTGAWTGAIAAVVLGMPFWSSFWANFFGVVIAGILVNLLVNLGVKAAVLVGLVLFAFSTCMWSFLRYLQGPAAAA